ncbi:MAG: hypothetical protein Q7Q71_12595 [Verrucomicrobiota bacterium JB023]|nr:hypothetical protein [Verrucomicrobiota bacterium JB023]
MKPTCRMLKWARLLLLVILANRATAQEEMPAAWPRQFHSPAPAVKAIPGNDALWRWQVESLRIHSTQSIPPRELQDLARTCHSLMALLKHLPLSLYHPPVEPLIIITPNQEAHVRLGAPELSAGYYDGRNSRLLIRGDQLLTPANGTSRLSPLVLDNPLLIHEMTHLAMHRSLRGLEPWLSEGLAEYFATSYAGEGRFRFDQLTHRIPQRILRFYPQETRPTLRLPSLATFIAFDSKGWTAHLKSLQPEERYQPYAAALLLTHYVLEGAERRTALDSHLRQLQAPSSRRQRRTARLSLEPSEVIERKLINYWQSRGLTLHFDESKD